MNHHKFKQRRAHKICHSALKMASDFGTSMPAHYPGCPEHASVVELLPLRIELLPNRYRTYLRKSEFMVGEGTIERAGWTVIDIRWLNERRACFNMGPDGLGEIEIYHFQPGIWEHKFGSDPQGDTVPILPSLFVDENEPAWQEFLKSEFSKWKSTGLQAQA